MARKRNIYKASVRSCARRILPLAVFGRIDGRSFGRLAAAHAASGDRLLVVVNRAKAPGRVSLGIGSGNTAYRFMNLKPLPIKR